MLFILASLLITSSAQHCNEHRIASCTSAPLSVCSSSYEFYWDEYAKWTVSPKNCKISGGQCIAGNSECMPPCNDNKIRGPKGYNCKLFLEEHCVQYYAVQKGETKWCAWDETFPGPEKCGYYQRSCYD